MKEQIVAILNQLQREAITPPLYEIHSYCKKAKIEIERPMRIAITGMIKTGKSTLLNALLGRYIALTAVETLTYLVHWFHHTDKSDDGTEKVLVHFHDGHTEIFPLSELNIFADKSKNKDWLDKIHWVDVYVEHPILKVFDIIDTPGLKSLLGTDSKHTQDFLINEQNRPDAIIYLMKKGFKQDDMDEVQEYHKATGLVSGINAMAALTRVDGLTNQYLGAQEIIERNKNEHAEIRYHFSEIFPIAALPAQASYTLLNNDINSLKLLANYNKIENYLDSKNQFEEDLSLLSFNERHNLWMQLDMSGIRFSIDYFRQNPEATVDDFRKRLYHFSNVETLQKYVISQFGERADFYKSIRVMAGLKKVCNEVARKCAGRNKEIVLSFLRKIKDLDYDLHNDYASYYILSEYYNQKNYFNKDEWEKAKWILGEYGQTDVERLGLPENATENEIQQAYQKAYSYWNNTSAQQYSTGNTTGSDVAKQIAEVVQTFINK